jgi:hypothetical protein
MLSDALSKQSGISELKFDVEIQPHIIVYTMTYIMPMRKVVLDQSGKYQVCSNVNFTF